MLDSILKVGSSFDWISPIASLIQSIYYRPSVGFNVPTGTCWSAYAIKTLLTKRGVRVWGLMIIGDTILFRVRRAQGLYAMYWLDKAGVSYRGGAV